MSDNNENKSLIDFFCIDLVVEVFANIFAAIFRFFH